MPEFKSDRITAEAIGRVKCIKTGAEIGLLYRWDNGETQAAMYYGSFYTLGVELEHRTNERGDADSDKRLE